VSKWPFSLGRGRGCDYRIGEMKISSKHCILHLQHDKDESFAVLEDLSTFGTFVNGVRCAGLTRLQNGVEMALNVDYR
jgi:predicted component of type VI protein secretion system